ncbi:MAG: HDIG domain-containing metalloprotein [Candidatus Aenigmatarchaeota archaeon]
MLDEKRAYEKVKENVDTENLRKHMYAVSAIMERLAEEFGEDEEKWKLVGLLHDVDYEETKDNPEEHALKSAEMLEEDLPEDCLRAIKAHNSMHTEVEPESKMSNSLIAADAISGLIVATALVMPNSTLEEVRVESVMKKMDDSSFAKNIDRDRIRYCEKIGLELEEFVELSLEAMEDIHGKLGL